MLDCYKFKREKIANIIKNSPITEDGYYFCKQFPKLNGSLSTTAKKEKGFTFDRAFFKNKLCFNIAEIELYLEKEPNNYNIATMMKKDNFLKDIIKDYKNFKLNKKIKDQEYTLGELIDSAIFVFNYKLNY